MRMNLCEDCAPEFDCWANRDAPCRKQPLVPAAGSATTCEERAILRLNRENENLHREIEELKKEMDSARAWLAVAGVPSGFEDGNSWDDYGFGERVGVLTKMYNRAAAYRDQLMLRVREGSTIKFDGGIIYAPSQNPELCCGNPSASATVQQP